MDLLSIYAIFQQGKIAYVDAMHAMNIGLDVPPMTKNRPNLQ